MAKKKLVPARNAEAARARKRPAKQPRIAKDEAGLFGRVARILEDARRRTLRAVNHQMVLAYWHIGREIQESLQGGDDRAPYGRKVIDTLSEQLTERFGRGFSTTNLRYFRMFHQVFSARTPEIRHIAGGESGEDSIRHNSGGALDDLASVVEGMNRARGLSPELGWSHYRALMKVEDPTERLFYEIEAEKEGWSVAHLERQIHTLLFARLLKSRDKEGALALAREGREIREPAEALKDP